MPEPGGFGPEIFAEILAHKTQPLLVGGQAVNIWAVHFLADEPALEAFAPFTSKDGDVFVEKPAAAEALEQETGWRLIRNHDPRSAVFGFLEGRSNPELMITVLRGVHGLDPDDLTRDAVIEIQPGRPCRLPLPEILLKAKLANLRDLSQENRQDEKHVRMLLPITRASLTRDHHDAAAGKLDERDVIERLNHLWATIRQPNVKTLGQNIGLDLRSAFPDRLDFTNTPKIQRFYRHQLDVA